MNWARTRSFFPVTREVAYLDNAGVAPISTRVEETLEKGRTGTLILRRQNLFGRICELEAWRDAIRDVADALSDLCKADGTGAGDRPCGRRVVRRQYNIGKPAGSVCDVARFWQKSAFRFACG